MSYPFKSCARVIFNMFSTTLWTPRACSLPHPRHHGPLSYPLQLVQGRVIVELHGAARNNSAHQRVREPHPTIDRACFSFPAPAEVKMDQLRQKEKDDLEVRERASLCLIVSYCCDIESVGRESQRSREGTEKTTKRKKRGSRGNGGERGSDREHFNHL